MSDDPIRDHLAELRRELGWVGSLRRRRLLAEVEDHLREAAAELEAQGVEPGEAARRAVESFGVPGEVAGVTAAPRIRLGVGVAIAAAAVVGVLGVRHSQPAPIRTAQPEPIKTAPIPAPKTSAAAVIRSINAGLPSQGVLRVSLGQPPTDHGRQFARPWMYIRIACPQCVGPYAEAQTLIAAYRRSAIADGFRPPSGTVLYTTVAQ